MRLKKNINLGIIRWSNTKFSELTLSKFYGWQLGEWQIWSVKGVYCKKPSIVININMNSEVHLHDMSIIRYLYHYKFINFFEELDLKC